MGKVTYLPGVQPPQPPAPLACVRVTNPDHNGFIEFQFSLGDPAIYLEMTLRPAAFREFCAAHNATHLSPQAAAAVDAAEHKWRYGADNED